MNYDKKNPDYYSNIRLDLVQFISNESNLKIMEIGAAYGETLFYLKENGIASEAVGVDLFEDKINPQNYKPLDNFIFGNIEEIHLEQYVNYFDVIFLPDVLEHLLEPKNVLNKISQYLKNDGKIIISMPNIRHYSAINKIFFKGDFSYEESGIFDYTHLRFYCRKNIIQLIEQSNYKVIIEQSSIKNYKGKSLTKIFNQITFGFFEEFLSYQYFFVATKVK
ncbi:class I SAM-dependent methyltransferase [Flavobacterium terrigena]|uniref:Methyltransferase domain-containing protein n=1 Tax=Flavobacterium terrigena TaxID=402734 RepID=A0A1H6TUZ4_9FLAO|nr:class I SAM-dependent methyltransferase [Flavobacterium terrigena]SEI79582.1 Methyltransferase domain-containing protein [Flavobacterium terrigena]